MGYGALGSPALWGLGPFWFPTEVQRIKVSLNILVGLKSSFARGEGNKAWPVLGRAETVLFVVNYESNGFL